MALQPGASRMPNRPWSLLGQAATNREARRQQWEMHSNYLKQQSVRNEREAAWTSRLSYQKCMLVYHKQRQKEERAASLEHRRDQLRILLQEEKDQLETELMGVALGRGALAGQLAQKAEELRVAREERREKLGQELLRERWKKNNPDLREVESALHKDHVVSHWQDQISEKKRREVAEKEEVKRYENEYERTRKEALERMRQAEKKKREEECKRAEELRNQMEELKLREEEATLLKKEQEVLLAKQWELEKIEEERKEMEKRQKTVELRRFLIRQYRTQLKRRAQQVQEELEADRKILVALQEEEEEDKWLEAARRERAVADAAWMKHVIEVQLKLEREREAEFDTLHRAQAQQVWEKREADWEKERKARERLMHEVLLGRKEQLELKLQKNRETQKKSLERREQLIQELELQQELRRRDKEQKESHKMARRQEIQAQIAQQRQEQWKEQCWMEQEEEKDREALRIQEEDLKREMQMMAKKGYQEKIHRRLRPAWT